MLWYLLFDLLCVFVCLCVEYDVCVNVSVDVYGVIV